MLRNIPNKYTREMLVKQLNQDFKGRFDFVYLPIDFKNKCNVGYGFVNFRTSASCDEFIAKYDGVDVRKCLPGLNSKKIAGVTPARVQGLEELWIAGPVMNELVNHPDWMPLLLDDKGEAMPFPMPDHPAPAPKLKRRAREEHSGGRGW
ncbi:Protein MEI2-like 4 (OML4) (MEI2-like protein 4) [Durusdinium trenchii]|uniref:Protein MEI2-like 4 (OML4) (MEI2-like protein 4) n=1 Tax=Durusdinium trenchii TaxID=1381693 RepID=A0ABP0ICB1_9DINO